MSTDEADKKPKRKTRAKPKSSEVPGQFLGYSLQFTRMLARLLGSSQGDAIALEHLDDVSVQSADGVLAEQNKSSLSQNPIADRSVQLWKTLHNWLAAIRSGALAVENTKFVLYVAQPYGGNLVEKLHQANVKEEADRLVKQIRQMFIDDPPSESLLGYVSPILGASDEVMSALIRAFSLENGSGRPNDDLRPLLLTRAAVSSESVDPILERLLGWVKRIVDGLISDNKPAIIRHEDFHKQLVACAKKHDRSLTALPSMPTEINPKDVRDHLQSRGYVRQLEIVGAQDEDLVRAVNDYLRASIHRTTWSESADVQEDSFKEFEDDLETNWHSLSELCRIEHQDKALEHVGLMTYHRCRIIAMRLQGMDVPGFFVPGSFHSLADALRVGWHPNYKNVMDNGAAPTGSDAPPESQDNGGAK